MKHRNRNPRGRKERKRKSCHHDLIERRLMACTALVGTLGTLITGLLPLIRH